MLSKKETSASKLKNKLVNKETEENLPMMVELGVLYYEKQKEKDITNVLLPCSFSDDLTMVDCIRCCVTDGFGFDIEPCSDYVKIKDDVLVPVENVVAMVSEDSDTYTSFWVALESALKITDSSFDSKAKKIFKNPKKDDEKKYEARTIADRFTKIDSPLVSKENEHKKEYESPEVHIQESEKPEPFKIVIKNFSDAVNDSDKRTLAIIDFGRNADINFVIKITDKFKDFLKLFS